MGAISDALDEYQQFTERTAVYPMILAVPYLALGLGDEAGELLEKVARFGMRNVDDTLAEVGDVTWYLAQLLLRRGVPLSAAYERSLTIGYEVEAMLLSVAVDVAVTCSLIQGRVKKELRDGMVNEAVVLDYAARVLRSLDTLSRAMGSNLPLVVERNRVKLLDRLERNVLKGEGDKR